MVPDIDELGNLDASEIHARRLDAKEIFTPKSGENLKFPIADGTVELSGGDQVIRKSNLIRDLRGESDGSHPSDETRDDAEARNDFWSIEGNFIYRHPGEPRVKIFLLKEELFPLPLRYIDVARRTNANTILDVLLESRKDDYWKVDGDQNISDPWTGFTEFTILHEKPPDGYAWSTREADKNSSLNKAQPEIWSRMSKSSLTKRRAAVGHRETEARQCKKVERLLMYRSGRS